MKKRTLGKSNLEVTALGLEQRAGRGDRPTALESVMNFTGNEP
jgi:hypothetical protein